MKVPKAIQRVVDNFEKLPGIGPKTAQRLGYYLLHVPQDQLSDFGDAVENLQHNTTLCSECFNVSSEKICPICDDDLRDESVLCVVEQPLDMLAIEKSGAFKGKYHILHGVINPLENIGPDQLRVAEMIPRINHGIISEIIIATNPTMEGEATALYLQRLIEKKHPEVKVTRIGRGLPTGADIEYADEVTLSRAFEGRREI